jgi:hypothetical protein
MKMKTITTIGVAIGVAVLATIPLGLAIIYTDPARTPSSSQTVDETEDFSNKADYTCDEESIKPELDKMIAETKSGHSGYKIIYIKNIVEISRSPDELKCSLTAHPNWGQEFSLTFRFYNQDGYALVGVDREDGLSLN